MEYLIQHKIEGTPWEQLPKTTVTFSSDASCFNFCKKLAEYLNTEVRLEHNGNGNYFSPKR